MLQLTYRCRNLVFFFLAEHVLMCMCQRVFQCIFPFFFFFFFPLQIKASGTPTADEEEDDLTKMHRFFIIIIVCMLYVWFNNDNKRCICKKTHVSFNHHYHWWRLRLAFACLIASKITLFCHKKYTCKIYYFVIKNINVRYKRARLFYFKYKI